MKVSLLNCLLCHIVFADTSFWSSYRQRLEEKIERETTSKAGEKEKQVRLGTLLERDIAFLKQVDINPLIGGILQLMIELVAPGEQAK